MTRRTVLASAGWLGLAVLAVLVGLAAVRVIGDGLTSEAGRPRTEAEVASTLAARGVTTPGASPAVRASSASPGSPASSASPAEIRTAATAVPRSFNTRGGTVVATCGGGRAEILSMAPLTGFAVHERDLGPRAGAEGEFRSTADNHDRVRFRVTCAAGRPALSDRDQ